MTEKKSGDRRAHPAPQAEAGLTTEALTVASIVLGWIATIKSPDDWPSAVQQAREAEITVDAALRTPSPPAETGSTVERVAREIAGVNAGHADWPDDFTPAWQKMINAAAARICAITDEGLREALERIAAIEQSHAYRGSDDELQDTLNLTHSLRECGDIARAALSPKGVSDVKGGGA